MSIAELKTLAVDDKWSVIYDPANNDRPVNWLRHSEPHHPWDENNSVTAMFYALLKQATTIEALQAQVAAKDAENEVMGGALTRISVGQPMTMMDGTTLMVCLPGVASQEIANVALAKVKRAALGQGEG